MKESKVYRIIKAMPKGAVLHIHDIAILGPEYMLNITYMDNLYVCFGKKTKFLFSNTTPNTSCDIGWQLMSNVRYAAKNITQFDLEIRKLFTMVVENPDIVYPTIQETWKRFLKHFRTVYDLLSFRPVFEQYLYDVLTAFRNDNIMYAELRAGFNKLYDLNGTLYDKITFSKLYKTIIDKFVKEHPSFYRAKVIYASTRQVDKQSLVNNIEVAREISKEVPELIAGFDLIGQEDVKPLIDLAVVLDTIKDLNFFFHAGETNWFGTRTDENLIDAVLLGAKRIGHAYALTKHPIVMKNVIEKGIGLEVNLLSNVVLSLVRDVRNHPLSIFLSLDLPVVLSSDDPGVWEAEPLSDDFYVAFVGVASRSSDIRLLKTLALNSLKYSALDHLNKKNAIRAFYVQWNNFINNFDCSFY
ncbi:unnamed protein product [Arctia plantaginis]|uniref:Adenosine deaminase n=1 Tax=Arctia plantaginis TaxID=874455 RepID=A0A8S0YS97_ARCPL|nr:unnamed protein product [Arctia plantaginis]